MIEKLKRALGRKTQPPPGPKPPISGPGVRCVAKYGAPASSRAASVGMVDPAYWGTATPILMLSGCNWKSSGGGQRPVALCREFANLGHPVLYHNCMQGTETHWAGGPLVLSGDALSGVVDQLLAAGKSGMVVLALPSAALVDQCVRLQRAGWTVVYDVIDDWEAFRASGDLTGDYSVPLEKQLARVADTVTASAHSLAAKVYRWAGRTATLVPNAGPHAPIPDCEPPGDMVFGLRGTCVYAGYLHGKWFDWPLLRQTCLDLPGVEFNLVGSYSGIDHLPDAPNLHYLGERPYEVAMQYVRHAGVGLIPFKLEALSEAVDPIKWYDYIAGRCRVVATWQLTEIHGRVGTLVCDDGAESMAPWIEAALAQGPLGGVETFLRQNCWRARAQAMLDAAGVKSPERE